MAEKMTYREQLLHPNWQRKRLEALESTGWECEKCGGKETTLHVHHRRYVKGRMAWEYTLDELRVLCAPCHESEHANRSVLDRLVDLIGLPAAIGILGGALDMDLSLDADLVEAVLTIDAHSYMVGAFGHFGAGESWKKLAEVAEILTAGRQMNPAEEAVLAKWKGDA